MGVREVYDPLRRVRQAFMEGRGVRLGESTVASRKVHFLDPSRPAVVRIGTALDAGRVFYGRSDEGRVIHIDVFHQVAQISHRRIAEAVLPLLSEYSRKYSLRIEDHTDIQTGTGGGRLSGQLIYGTKASLRKAHLNHVHFALMLDNDHLEPLFGLVDATEKAILKQGAEIRKIERLINDAGERGNSMDLSPYRSFTDSLLQEPRNDASPDRTIQEQMSLFMAVSLADHFGSIRDVEEILNAIGDEMKMQALATTLAHRKQSLVEAIETLAAKGLVTRQGHKPLLTSEGMKIKRFFAEARLDIEAEFKRLLRKLPTIRPPVERCGYGRGNGKPGALLKTKTTRSPDNGEWLSNIALPESAISACRRNCLEGRRKFSFTETDIRLYRTWGKKSIDICLLIDASASMAGRRMKAAKYLVRHLLLSTHEKVAVVVFQEADSTVYVPFTRNYHKVEEGLVLMQPVGLTPLAEGIYFALNYIKKSLARNPLLLLITDGIPTVPKWTLNPLEDALSASDYIASNKVKFSCIGLQPNRSFLEDLAKRAHGSLYVIDEIVEGVLINIAHQERDKLLRH